MKDNAPQQSHVAELILSGAAAGIVGSAAMGMFAMVASATYQHHGFFTPLFHISAVTGTPSSMMTSMQQAMAGHRFWFTGGAALVGAIIHMMSGAMFGVAFASVARRAPGRSLVPTGAAFGVMAFMLSAYVLLPVAASASGAGSVISDMASMVGEGTFFAEHVVFGVATAVVWSAILARRAGAAAPTPAGRRAAPAI